MNTIRSYRPQSLRFAPAITLGLAAVVLPSFAVVALGAGGAAATPGRPSRRRAPRPRPPP